MYVKTYELAKAQAKANAQRFNMPYSVFRDTAGNYRVERGVREAAIYVANPPEPKGLWVVPRNTGG